MPGKCDVCGKTISVGHSVSHSQRKSKRTWSPNLQRVRAVVNGEVKKIDVCTRCLRSGAVKRAVRTPGPKRPAGFLPGRPLSPSA